MWIAIIFSNMIQFEQVCKYYNQQKILGISIGKLDKGVYWLQGLNGSGKTTLLRMLAGMIPFKGEICWMESDGNGKNQHKMP